MIWMDVDTAIAGCPVNVSALIDDTDFKTREEAVAYNESGMALVWNFVTTAGVYTETWVTPTSAGDYDWSNKGYGMYAIEIPASGGGDINNTAEGFGWFTGYADGILPWTGPTIGFRAEALNKLLIDEAFSVTRGFAGTALPDAAADASGGLVTSDEAGLKFEDLYHSVVLFKGTIGTNNRTTTSCELDASAADNDDAYIGCRVVLDDDNGDEEYVARTVTDYVGATKTITWTPAITENAEDGGPIWIVPGDTKVNVTADAIKAISDNLPDSGSLSDLATLAARLTAARAGYLDNLNIGEKVAGTSEVTSIQNNTRCVRVVPTVIERPDSGSTTYRIELLLYDDAGNMEAPDAAPTVALVNEAGTDRSARLDSTTMALVSTGRYRCIYTESSANALEQLVWAFSVLEGGKTRIYGNTSLIVDTTAVDFTAADRTKLSAIDTLTKAAGDGDLAAVKGIIDNLPDSGSLSDLATLAARLTAARAGYVDELAAGNIPGDIDGIKGIINNLPDSGSLSDLATLAARLTAARAGYLDELAAANIPADVDTIKAVTDVSIYTATVDLAIDATNTKDEYIVQWFKDGVPVTSGVTSPTIQVVKRADGTDLIAVQAMSEIVAGAYKYDAESTERTTAGEGVLVIVVATIDGSPRAWRVPLSRDSTA